ncbi:MAG: ArsR family transcriptional regulator [Candidatus Thermoplasmatota archaeon]|nr:ArsR family transcriptional regulator [Candidatus Thermoplasmatota archaeon]
MTMNESPERNDETLDSMMGAVKSTIINKLSESEMSMNELSSFLGINKNAVKEHMEAMEQKGLVRSFFRNGKMGRPGKYYELTEKGMELFPKKYSLLSSMLLDEVEKEFGQSKLNEILGRVANRLVDSTGINSSLNDQQSREDKISRLKDYVFALNQLGYYARMEIDGDTVRIIRSNCIFFELAKNNTRIICGSLGKQMISKSVNTDFNIVEKFSTGDKRCVVELKL